MTLKQLIEEVREKFKKEFWKIGGAGIGDLERKQDEYVAEIITQVFRVGEAQGADWAVDMIKTDSLFAREDVHDGNEGHYRVSQKTLEAARQGDKENESV